jgi:hypothetical protein
MKRIKLFIMTLLVVLGLGGGLLVPALAQASPKSEVCNTLGGGADCTKQPSNGIDLNNVITAAINLMSVFVGIVSVIMIIVSGFKYVTSAGDSSKVASAKNTLIYAIIGLVVVAMAQVIVQFVLNKVTNQPSKKGFIHATPAHQYASVNKRYTLNF